jgi:hypothetical protein
MLLMVMVKIRRRSVAPRIDHAATVAGTSAIAPTSGPGVPNPPDKQT